VTATLPSPSAAPLPRAFFDRTAEEVAADLLGQVIARDSPEGRVAVRLTETEAYGGVGADPGSHAHRRLTARNASMFGAPGTLYVYFTYGMHWCVNVVTGPVGEASAVLLRAGDVVDGFDLARARRPAARRDVDLARGPARLAQCLGLDRDADGTDLLDGSGPASLSAGPAPAAGLIRSGPRVGVTGGHETPWRFWVDGEPTVSAYRPAVRRSRAKPDSADAGESSP
jgi:DNA-3-methyladenine glycosylase